MMNSPVDVDSDQILSCEKSSSVVDLSQNNERLTPTDKVIFVDDWTTNNFKIDDQLDFVERVEPISTGNSFSFDVERSLVDQIKDSSTTDLSRSDKTDFHRSEIDSRSNKRIIKPRKVLVEKLKSIDNSRTQIPSAFLWSKHLSLVDERAISEEFFDHYLASVRSEIEVDMKIEYCYDTQQDLYWLAQIQLVSYRLILLHYLGLPESETSSDFWADIYGKRCRPIGWCRENSKLMIPPPIVKKRVIQQTSTNHSSLSASFNERQSNSKNETDDLLTPPEYTFDKNIGLTPVELLKVGMILEIQDFQRPWTSWFVRIVSNCGGRLTLNYIVAIDDQIDSTTNDFIHLFYLDWHIHPVGWTKKHSDKYIYDVPTDRIVQVEKETMVDFCFSQAEQQFLPKSLFDEQEKIREHRFTAGMKLEVFDTKSLNVYIGEVTEVYNEFYFRVELDDENRSSFVAHGRNPFILPAHWASDHRLVLMKGKSIRQSEEFWTNYTETHGIHDIAPESCFHLIKLNSNGSNRVEPGMKLEMISTFNGEDRVFSVTLIMIIDHLMWLRIDNRLAIDSEHSLYRVVPINSLDIFPVGWAKYSGFQLVTPIEYQIETERSEQDLRHLFSSVSKCPRVPRVYLEKFYELTLFVNIRCFPGPNLCSSRLARMPSQIGPGPYRLVLIDLFHQLLSASSTSAHRALRRLEHLPNVDGSMNCLKTELIKVAKKSGKFIRPVVLPTDPRLINHFLRHVCTQLESCPNLISMQPNESHCPDQCSQLIQTFVLSTHSKNKRNGAAQLRAAHLRQKRQKSLLGHLKNDNSSATISTTINEDIPLIESPTEQTNNVESSSSTSNETNHVVPAGSDRKTRGFRVHIEPRTHTVTRTNRKQKLALEQAIKQEQNDLSPSSMNFDMGSTNSTLNHEPPKTKRNRAQKKRHSPSPVPSPLVTVNILSPPANNSSTTKNNRKKRRSSPSTTNTDSSPNEESNSNLSTLSSPPSTNPVTWNVNDVCWYLNQSGCSFALKTIQEQEIDGAALLLLDDLPKVQDLLEFKLGPAVKFCHVVGQLRSQVIESIRCSPSLKPKRLSSNSS